MNQKIDNEDPNAIMNQARAMATEHMTCIAREMVAWSDTGILPDGWLREIAKTIAPLCHHQDSLGMAEHIARKLMIEKIACRDETIMLKDRAIKELKNKVNKLSTALCEIVEFKDEMYFDRDGCFMRDIARKALNDQGTEGSD